MGGACVCVGRAALFLLPDMGRVDRILDLILIPHWSSPLIWDVTIITLYATISLVYLWLHVREDRKGATPGDHRAVKAMAYVALPAAIAIHSVTAWIFGLQSARPYWFSEIMAPLFVTSALVSGLSLLLLALLLLQRLRLYRVATETVTWLGGLLAVFIAVQKWFIRGMAEGMKF